MRNNLLAGILMLLVAVGMGSCKESVAPSAKKTVIDVLIDNTEESAGRSTICPEANLKNALYGDGNGYGTILFRGLNSVALGKEETVNFTPRMSGETDMQYTDRQAEFDATMDSCYKRYMGPSKGDSFSRLYKPVCEALNKLSIQKADKKILIMIGDGVEYSQDGNFYKVTSKDSIEKELKLMEKVDTLPTNPNGVKVIFLYSPKDKKAEMFHEHAMLVWAALFKKHKISYEVKPNL